MSRRRRDPGAERECFPVKRFTQADQGGTGLALGQKQYGAFAQGVDQLVQYGACAFTTVTVFIACSPLPQRIIGNERTRIRPGLTITMAPFSRSFSIPGRFASNIATWSWRTPGRGASKQNNAWLSDSGPQANNAPNDLRTE